jgi:uncharacterized membrane-anchored protein YitT (DUF2179 family)
MDKKHLAIIKDFLYLTIADGIIGAAVYFFLVPSQAAVSSISGLAIVLTNIIPLPISLITLILNVILLILGFLVCGKEFGGKTVYTSLLLSAYLALYEHLFPNYTSMTGSAELDVLCYILIVSFGLAIMFNRNASSGGLDIVAKIMNQYLHIELGKAMTIAGICVAMTTVFFYDKKIVVLSLLGTYFNGMILDHFIFGQNLKRRVCIISEKQKMIQNFLIEEIGSGATMYEAIGAYKMEKHMELITIVDKKEYQKLMGFLRKNDPKAFVTVYTVSDMHYAVKS